MWKSMMNLFSLLVLFNDLSLSLTKTHKVTFIHSHSHTPQAHMYRNTFTRMCTTRMCTRPSTHTQTLRHAHTLTYTHTHIHTHTHTHTRSHALSNIHRLTNMMRHLFSWVKEAMTTDFVSVAEKVEPNLDSRVRVPGVLVKLITFLNPHSVYI